MAFRKTLITQIVHLNNNISQIKALNRSLSQSQNLILQNHAITTFNREFLTSADPRLSFYKRIHQKREIGTQSSVVPPTSLPFGDKLIEKLKSINVCKNRIRFDGLITPVPSSPPVKESDYGLDMISVKDAKKLLKLAHLEMLKMNLRQIEKKSISYSEFVQICVECSNSDQGLEFAKMLDESGSVIVLGKTVFLRPEEVTRAIGGLIPLPVAQRDDPRKIELEKMEKEKAEIDERAQILVKRELWAGLGFMTIQTAGFMRLTFWELSWDVMEPICFFVTSMYFMAGYTFFMRTSKEPSFEGFFQSRFTAKQKKLMKKKQFDVERFNELKRIYYPFSSSKSTSSSFDTFTPLDKSERTLMSALQN